MALPMRDSVVKPGRVDFLIPRTIREVLKDAGATIGQQGNNKRVRVVPNLAELNSVFNELSRGGAVVPSGTYKGISIKMPDGSFIRKRAISRSGGWTIDITGADGATLKIHIGG
jgi:hypothetical protein